MRGMLPMIAPLTPVAATLLEKAATDNGFDRELPREGAWLRFSSSQCPLRIWLAPLAAGGFAAALSRENVAAALAEHGAEAAVPLPPGARAARLAPAIAQLDRLLRRAFQLSRTLPDELLHRFEDATEGLPRATEAERLVVERVGQGVFRAGLLDYWEGRCAVTGLAVPELLRASHVKPWADCATDAERLDVFNGLLLAAHLDAAFDAGFVTVADDGALVVAAALDEPARALLGLDRPLRVRRLADGHRAYLPWHRAKVFRGPAA